MWVNKALEWVRHCDFPRNRHRVQVLLQQKRALLCELGSCLTVFENVFVGKFGKGLFGKGVAEIEVEKVKFLETAFDDPLGVPAGIGAHTDLVDSGDARGLPVQLVLARLDAEAPRRADRAVAVEGTPGGPALHLGGGGGGGGLCRGVAPLADRVVLSGVDDELAVVVCGDGTLDFELCVTAFCSWNTWG